MRSAGEGCDAARGALSAVSGFGAGVSMGVRSGTPSILAASPRRVNRFSALSFPARLL